MWEGGLGGERCGREVCEVGGVGGRSVGAIEEQDMPSHVPI